MNPNFDSIGKQFVEQYYRVFDNKEIRGQVAAMYHPMDALLTFEGQQFQGVETIAEKMKTIPLDNMFRHITTIDCQPTIDGGVLVNVIGQLKMLEENNQLIQTITEFQHRGKINDCIEYQKILHRNLIYLGNLVDSYTDASLQVAGNQQEHGTLGSQVVQIQTSGPDNTIGQVDNRVYSQQQRDVVQKESSKMGQESGMSQNHPITTLVAQNKTVLLSENIVGQTKNEMLSQKQAGLTHNQQMSQGQTSDIVLSLDSMPLLEVSGLDECVRSQQGLLYSNQQGYTQQQKFSDQTHKPGLSQHTHSGHVPTAQQVQYVTVKPNQDGKEYFQL